MKRAFFMPTLLSQPTSSSCRTRNFPIAVGNHSTVQSSHCSPQTKKTFAPSFKNTLLSLVLFLGLFSTTQHWTTTYDGLGRRIQTSSGGNIVNYYYDPEVEFLELGHNINGSRTWNLYGPDRSGFYGGAQGIGGLESCFDENTHASFGIVNNYFGDVVGLMSGGSFTPYQSDLGSYGPMPGSSVNQAFQPQWRSHYLDQTGFICMGARYYDPQSGRFISPDPLGHGASMSLYDYCNGDPVNGLDPDGRCVESGTSGASSGWGHGNGGFAGEYNSSNAKNQFAYNIGWSGGALIGDINAITRPFDKFTAGVVGTAFYGLNTAIESTEEYLGGPGARGAIGFMAPLMALEIEAAASTTAAIEETGVVSKIPLPLPTSSGYNPWAGPIDSLVTKNDTIMYRTWGGGAGKVGAWLSPVKPTSTLSSIRNFALPIENSAEFFSKVLVPAGTRYQIGKSASAFGQPGGDIQVLLLDRISPANFGPTIPLAPWL